LSNGAFSIEEDNIKSFASSHPKLTTLVQQNNKTLLNKGISLLINV